MNFLLLIIFKQMSVEYFQKSVLEKIIKEECYAFIESQTCNNVCEEDNVRLFQLLDQLLTQEGLQHRQVIGSYNGDETEFSYIAIKPASMAETSFRRVVFKLGQKFNQESIIISSAGKVELLFTTGPNAGRSYCGSGFHEVKDNYSIINCDHDENVIIGEYNLDRNVISEIDADLVKFCL
jgi:hypothetical protein